MSVLPAKKFDEWVVELRNSNEEAFSELFRETYNPMLRYAVRFVIDEESARDILQEVYVKLWHKRFELDEEKSLKAFLYRMVRNKCFNFLRDNSREVIGIEEHEPVDHKEDHSTDNSEVENLKTQLNQWIEELPNRQREAFELSRFEGLDHTEIAGIMECSPRTVNNHIVSALNYFRNRYKHSNNNI